MIHAMYASTMTKSYVPRKPRDFDSPYEVRTTLEELYDWRPELRKDPTLDSVRLFANDSSDPSGAPVAGAPFSKLFLQARTGFQRLSHLVKLMEYEQRKHGTRDSDGNSSTAKTG